MTEIESIDDDDDDTLKEAFSNVVEKAAFCVNRKRAMLNFF